MLTIIIPTMNRMEFVIRQLRYYKIHKLDAKIIIGDSSSIDYAEQLQKEILDLHMDNVTFCNHERLTISETVRLLLEQVNTKYVTIIGDDDFLVGTGIKESIDFLEMDDSYIACHGKSFVISIEGDATHGKINGLYPYRQPVLNFDTVKKRLLFFAKHYSTPLFAIHRIDVFKKMYSYCNVQDKILSEELIPSFVGVAIGNYKEIDSLYMVRQTHKNQFSLPSIADWTTSYQWLSDYSKFKSFYSKILNELDNNISFGNCENLSDEMMGIYINTSYLTQENNFFRKTIKKVMNKNKFLIQCYEYFVNSVKYNIDSELKKELTENRKYKKDFNDLMVFIVC